MTMGAVSRENGVLKLVHPGGFVELHKNPITAAEVMRKYPRHCVTRPDVFKFPWIVVRPESVLNPGKVFFVVPYHTIHRLLQSNGYRNHSSLGQQGHSVKHCQDCRPRLKKTFPLESRAKVAPKHLSRDSCVNKQSRVVSYDHKFYKERYPVESLVESTHFHQLDKKQSPIESQQDADGPPRKQYPVEHWPTETVVYKHHQQTPEDSFVEARTLDYAFDDAQGGGALSSNDDGVEKITKLKSCLKKYKNNIPKPRLRVTFAFPG